MPQQDLGDYPVYAYQVYGHGAVPPYPAHGAVPPIAPAIGSSGGGSQLAVANPLIAAATEQRAGGGIQPPPPGMPSFPSPPGPLGPPAAIQPSAEELGTAIVESALAQWTGMAQQGAVAVQ